MLVIYEDCTSENPQKTHGHDESAFITFTVHKCEHILKLIYF